MSFYGPTFPNETNSEMLLHGRQRFGNRSANMFFVRPARHIACPRRLKYIHDIKTGYIPYVEDTPYPDQRSHRHDFQNFNDGTSNRSMNGLGLYNSADAWRHELMDLAQQVKSSMSSHEDQEQYLRSCRSSHIRRFQPRRSNSSVSNYPSENHDEQSVSKRLLSRRASQGYQRSKMTKPKNENEKAADQEQTNSEESQDPGIWLIPILCYVLQIDNIFEAQDWLVNANPTEKRLAMELISRTMQDMQHHENAFSPEMSTSDLSTASMPQTSSSPNLNNVYWPYKIWQRQEKDRQQNQLQSFLKQSKLSSFPSLPTLNIDNGETCERATSPLRILTPAKQLLSASPRLTNANHRHIPVETTVIERPSTRQANGRTTPSVVIRQSPNGNTDEANVTEKRPGSRASTPVIMNGKDRLSRRGFRVTTSFNRSTDDEAKPTSPTLRGKTPLI